MKILMIETEDSSLENAIWGDQVVMVMQFNYFPRPVSINDAFCIENHEVCIENDGFCTTVGHIA